MSSCQADATALRAVAAFESYLASYAARDLPGIISHLDNDIEVWMGEKRVACGRSAILPSYEADWARRTVVDVTRPATAGPETMDGTVVIRVGLRSSPPEESRGQDGAKIVCLDVQYTLRVLDMVQVRHDITVTSTEAT